MGDATWKTPKISPTEVLNRYGALLEHVPTAKAWAKIDGALIHFYTVLDFGHPGAEAALLDAERQLVDQFGPDIVEFDVYPDLSPIRSELGELAAVPGKLAA